VRTLQIKVKILQQNIEMKKPPTSNFNKIVSYLTSLWIIEEI